MPDKTLVVPRCSCHLAMPGYSYSHSHSYARGARNVQRNCALKHLFFTSGVHYWVIDVARMGQRGSMVVGAVPSEAFDSETLNGPCVSWTDGAVGYAAYGAIIQNGKEVESRVEPFHAGDAVGVQLDLNARTVAFFLNGCEVARTGGHFVDDETAAVAPIHFESRAMFAGVSFTADTDEFDVYVTPLPLR